MNCPRCGNALTYKKQITCSWGAFFGLLPIWALSIGLLYLWLSSDVNGLFTKGGILAIIGTTIFVYFIPKFFLNVKIKKYYRCVACAHEETQEINS